MFITSWRRREFFRSKTRHERCDVMLGMSYSSRWATWERAAMRNPEERSAVSHLVHWTKKIDSKLRFTVRLTDVQKKQRATWMFEGLGMADSSSARIRLSCMKLVEDYMHWNWKGVVYFRYYPSTR